MTYLFPGSHRLPESIMPEADELCPLAHGLLCSICDNAAWDMLISQIIHGLVLGAGHKANRLVLQCINGASSNPVEGRTKIWQLKDLILTLFCLFVRRIYLRNNSTVFEELEVSIVDLTVANAVLLATRSGASKTDICDRQIHNWHLQLFNYSTVIPILLKFSQRVHTSLKTYK
jgi:hypothetical protein